MCETIDVRIIKEDLLKSIADKFSIQYELLLEELNNINQTKVQKSKYSCDHHFFSRDNEQSIYWAGFIAADGCVHKRKKGGSKTLQISLSEKDADHLARFKSDINFNGQIYKSVTKHSSKNPKWNDSVKRSVSVSSFQMFKDLKRFNIFPAKTHKYTFPDWLVSHELVNHFMRGYVDGDGSFFYDKTRPRVCFELRGTYEFLKSFKEIIDKNISYKSKNIVTTPDSTSKIKYYSKKSVPQIVDFLYRDASVYLSRKYFIAKKSHDILRAI